MTAAQSTVAPRQMTNPSRCAQALHLPHITPYAAELCNRAAARHDVAGGSFDGKRYVTRCLCGWQTTPRTSRDRANAAHASHRHVVTLAATATAEATR